MRLSKLWKVGAVVAVIAVTAIVVAACAAPKTAGGLGVNADTVIGSTGVKNPADICVVSSRFPQGESVVWRIKVYDPTTGQPLDDKALKSVAVTLNDGQTFSATYGGHPGQPGVQPTDYFWSTAWAIPTSYPTGSVPYQVTATSNDGRTGSFTEFNVAPSLLTVVAGQ
jgi:hypothetical protein